MCQFKSAIVLKDRVFVADYDHHTQMLEELKIEDTRRNAENLFVRVELIPQDDYFSDIETWELNVDQDIIPEWFIEKVDKPRVINVVKLWAEKHIFVDKNDMDLKDGFYYLKNCKNVKFNNSTVKVYGNSTVEACDNSTVEAYGNSTVEACDNSTVKAYGNSTVEAYGNSTVVKTEYSSIKKENIVLAQNSTFKDCSTKTIYQSGDWKLVLVNN